jgi:hypothetical protein
MSRPCSSVLHGQQVRPTFDMLSPDTQNDRIALRGDAEVHAALQRCVAASVPSAGARATADAAQKAAMLAQLQKHSGAAKVPLLSAGQCAGTLRLKAVYSCLWNPAFWLKRQVYTC